MIHPDLLKWAAAVIYLASAAAALVTGTTLLVDGGWTAQEGAVMAARDAGRHGSRSRLCRERFSGPGSRVAHQPGNGCRGVFDKIVNSFDTCGTGR